MNDYNRMFPLFVYLKTHIEKILHHSHITPSLLVVIYGIAPKVDLFNYQIK